jgi:hypothetical protein
MTTKADKLRAELRDNSNLLLRDRAIKIVGSSGGLSHMLKTGEISVRDIEGVQHIVLDPDYTKARKTEKTLPIKRRAKKKRGHKKPARSARPKPCAPSLTKSPPAPTPPLKPLALRQLITACRLLRQTVTNQVEGLEDNPMLTGAMQNAEAAESLAEAA